MENIENETVDNSLSAITGNLATTPADWSIGTLLNYVDRGFVSFPDFQRNYVWDKHKASKLIESLAVNLPVPQIYVFRSARNRYQVIDGQQRILSLYFFKAGRFPRKSVKARLKGMGSENHFITEQEFRNDEYFENFALKFPSDSYSGIENPLNNKIYDDLEENYLFSSLPIRIMIITSDSNDPMYEIYSRLNSGGVNLNDQEIRMSLGMSDFMRKLVKEVNTMREWWAILGRSGPDPRYKDLEILLRLCAAADSKINEEGLIEYQAPMNRFLNRYVEMVKDFNDFEIKRRIESLKNFIYTLNDSDHAYIREGAKSVSRPTLEGLYGAFYKSNLKVLSSDLISEIINDDNFVNNASDKTTAKSQYEGRIMRALNFMERDNNATGSLS